MIFGIGLPRCAGQSLWQSLTHATGGKVFWHSIRGADWSHLQQDHGGAVECYQPYAWFERHWPGSLFVANHREVTAWKNSCERIYQQSIERNYNHPLWEYPPTSWVDYYNDYWQWIQTTFPQDRVFWWDITTDPTWDGLCNFLGLPVPDMPFPDADMHGRRGGIIMDEDSSFPSPW